MFWVIQSNVSLTKKRTSADFDFAMATTSLPVLFECAAGYALFNVLEADEIATLLQEVASRFYILS